MFTKEKNLEFELEKLTIEERAYIFKIIKVHYEMKKEKERKPLAYINSFENALRKHFK